MATRAISWSPITVAVLFVTFAAHALAAAPASSLTASAMRAEGSVEVGGRLAAVLFEDAALDARVIAEFQLQATRMTMESDHSDPAVYLPVDVSSVGIPTQPAPREYGESVVTSTAHEAGFQWLVFALDGHPAPALRVSSPCGDLASSDQESVERDAFVATPSQRAPMRASVSAALEWDACADAKVTISGAFLMGLWKTDARIESAHGAEEIWTGSRRSSYSPPGGPADASLREDRQVFLRVEEGVLTVNHEPGLGPLLALQGDVTAEAAEFLLHDTRGIVQLPGRTEEILGETATIQGALRATLRSQGRSQPLEATLAGDIQSVTVAGSQVFFATDAAGASAWWWALLGVPVAAVGVAANRVPVWEGRRVLGEEGVAQSKIRVYAARRLRSLAFALWAYQAETRKRHRLALLLASRALRHDADGHEARLVRCKAATALGRDQAALADHALLDERLRLRHDLANNAIQAAKTALREADRHDEALGWLAKAREYDVGILRSALSDVAFVALRAHPWIRLQRQESAWSEIAPAYQ